MHKEKWNDRYREQESAGPGRPSPVLEKIVGQGHTSGERRPDPADLSDPAEAYGTVLGAALDLAAGTGRNAVYLAQQGWDVTAVDFSDVAVERGAGLSRELGLQITWLAEDLAAYRPPEESFDLVCLFYLHMPLAELKPIFARAAMALRSGGLLLIVGHDLRNMREGSGGPQNPEVLYSPEQISSMLEDHIRVTYAASEMHEVDHGEHHAEALSHGAGKPVQVDCVVTARR